MKILIADDDIHNSSKTKAYLEKHGFVVKTASDGNDAIKLISNWQPQFLIVELFLPRKNAIKILTEIGESKVGPCKVVVMSNHSDKRNIKRCIDLGAVDYLLKPFSDLEICNRIIFHAKNLSDVPLTQEDFKMPEAASKSLHLTSLLLKQVLKSRTEKDTFKNVCKMVAKHLKAVRCNIVKIEGDIPSHGTVLASSDDDKLPEIQIGLNKYPEISYCHRSQKVVLIENIESDATLAKIKPYLENVWFNSLIVCPILKHGKPMGVISARFPEERKRISEEDVQFFTIAAQAISLSITNFNAINTESEDAA